jgi:uracil-DNA glycosylase
MIVIMTMGNVSAKATMPSHAGEPVSSQVSQPSETLNSQRPVVLMPLLHHISL